MVQRAANRRGCVTIISHRLLRFWQSSKIICGNCIRFENEYSLFRLYFDIPHSNRSSYLCTFATARVSLNHNHRICFDHMELNFSLGDKLGTALHCCCPFAEKPSSPPRWRRVSNIIFFLCFVLLCSRQIRPNWSNFESRMRNLEFVR